MPGFEPTDLPEEIAQLLPEAAALEFPRQGETSELAYVVGSDLVVKHCRGALYSLGLQGEHTALQALAESDLPVPRAVGFHAEKESAWLVMTRLPGEPLWNVIERSQDSEVRARWFRELGALLARIHSTPVPPALRPAEPRRWLERVLARARRFSRRWVRELATRLDRNRPPDLPDTLIHGDFTIDNVLAHEGEISGVIDWGGAGLGDPRYDVTLALATQPEIQLAPEVVSAFFDGYGAAALPADLRRFFESVYELI